jgi:hypothetical protein
MSAECLCGQNIGNLASPNCPPLIGKILKVNFQNRFQDNGTENYLDTTTTLNKAFWDALQYHTNTSIRWYPISEQLEEVDTPKEDTHKKTYKSGRIVKLKQGVRNFKATIPVVAAPLVDKINSRGCTKDSVYFFTTKGVLGWRKEAGKLHGIPVATDSLDAVLQLQNEDDPQRIELMLQWADTVTDGQLAIIPYSEITGIDLLNAFMGKLDTNIVQVGTGTATVIVVDIYLDYGDAVNMIPVEGLVEADVQLYNVTDSAVISKTFVESATVPGRYTITVSAQTVTDIERLSLLSTDAAKHFDDATWADVQLKHQA